MSGSLALPSYKVTLPAVGHEAQYATREVSIRVTPASELIAWVLDLGEATGAGEAILQVIASGDAGGLLVALTRPGSRRTMELLMHLLRYTTITYHHRRLEITSREAFDEAFSDELLLLVDVLKEVFKRNFESFSRGLAPAREPTATTVPE